MNRFEVWLLHISTFIVSLTGLIYAFMHYEMKPVDPFSVVNHPLEPYMMDFHILSAPALVLGLGLIVHSHILWKLSNKSRIARRTGILMIPLFVIMALSGYLLQVITGSFRTALIGVHLISGAIWFGIYVAHQIASLRFRRSLNSRPDSLRIP